jgi:prepilin peptidase CpaA
MTGAAGPVMLSIPALFVFPILMAYAASSDLLTMRIANWLVLALTVAWVGLSLVAQLSWTEMGLSLAGAGVVLIVAFVFFAFGWIGGGDAKLVAVTSLWVGFGFMLPYLVYAALLGGGLTLVILAVRRYPLPTRLARIKWIDRLHDTRSGVPYGIALAIAGMLVYPETTLFTHFAG